MILGYRNGHTITLEPKFEFGEPAPYASIYERNGGNGRIVLDNIKLEPEMFYQIIKPLIDEGEKQ